MANAGRVAIVPKGDYSSATAYKRLDLVRYNNNAYVAKKASTGVAPTDTTYWMLAMENITQQQYDDLVNGTTPAGKAAALTDEEAAKWQTKLDNIQTTSRATLSQAGWYRVAEYSGAVAGDEANSTQLIIKKHWSSMSAEYHKLLINTVSKGTNEIKSLTSNATNKIIHFTKARLVYDTVNAKSYIEVYYNVAVSNEAVFELTHVTGRKYSWQAITPTLTEETVSGVTVTTTYDIPANASPVTDLDLVPLKGTETLNTSILEKSVSLPLGIYSYRLGGAGYTGGDVPKYYNYSEATIIRREKGTMCVILWGTYNVTAPIINYYDGSGWTGWDDFVTRNALATELANYLPVNGKTSMTDFLQIGNESLKTVATLLIKNSARQVVYQTDANGEHYLYDSTNNKKVFRTTADGTNTFNGVATGCLPLDGGGTVKSAESTAITVENTSGNSSLIRYRGTSGILGYIGYNAVDNPVVYSPNIGTQRILHEGNSAKVVVSASAPSNTSALWVDTANKKVKAYIDGAWTAMA